MGPIQRHAQGLGLTPQRGNTSLHHGYVAQGAGIRFGSVEIGAFPGFFSRDEIPVSIDLAESVRSESRRFDFAASASH
jgi:hypothetical protein